MKGKKNLSLKRLFLKLIAAYNHIDKILGLCGKLDLNISIRKGKLLWKKYK